VRSFDPASLTSNQSSPQRVTLSSSLSSLALFGASGDTSADHTGVANMASYRVTGATVGGSASHSSRKNTCSCEASNANGRPKALLVIILRHDIFLAETTRLFGIC